VDILLLKDDQLICFECKAFNPLKKVTFNDVADIIKIKDLVDRVILVITGNLKERDRMTLKEQSIEIIDGLSIEKLDKLLK